MIKRRLSLYERICKIFGKVKIKPPKQLREDYQEEILFCHLQITPEEAFSTAIFLPALTFFLLLFLSDLFNLLTTEFFGVLVIFTSILFYFLLNYTKFLTRLYRSKASSEMVLAITYMAMIIRITHNLEKAIEFVAKNLSGPLGLDFKDIYWKIKTNELKNAEDGLEEISKKWRAESQEFVDALSLLRISLVQPPSKSEKTIDEAVEIVLNGTESRLKEYVVEMKTPLKVISAFGVLLPMLVMIFLPLVSIFTPELIDIQSIIFLYDLVVPFSLYLILSQYIYSKPTSYHQIEKGKIKSYNIRKILSITLSLFPVLLIIFTAYKLKNTNLHEFNNEQFNYSLLVVFLFGFSISLNYLIRSFGYRTVSKELMKIEDEIPNFLMQLSVVTKTGKPIEKSLEELIPRLRKFRIKSVIEDLVSRIRNQGMTLENAIKGENGIISFYPSNMLKIVLENVVDIYKKGVFMLSISLKTMQKYFNTLKEIDRTATELLSEVTSELEVTSRVVAPLASGIVIGLVAITLYIFYFFAPQFKDIGKEIGQNINDLFFIFGNLQNQIPFAFYQLSVGIYMIELSFILTWFVGNIRYGENKIEKMFFIGKNLLVSLLLYTIVVTLLYYGMSGILNLYTLTNI